MSEAIDPAFIRRAVEAADLDALRAALLQATKDPELEALGPVPTLETDGLERLKARMASLIESGWEGFPKAAPSDVEVRRLMDLVLGEPTRDEHFEVRKKMLAFEPFPFRYSRADGPLDVPDDFRVAIVGAGPAGIAAAVQLEHLGIPYVIYERRDEVGGTWSRNTYPDIRVDTLSITYEFTFDEQYPWSEYFARGGEVRAYLEYMARKHGVYEHIRFDRAVERARWDEASSSWQLSLKDSEGNAEQARFAVVITASGLFANARYPDIPGIDTFRGEIVHPTEWPRDLDVRGKRVAVVGNGSTGVQLLAPVAEEAAHVSVFQRTPQWISPRPQYGEAVEPEVRWLLDHIPGYWNWCRYTSMISLFNWHDEYLTPDPDWEAQGGTITKKSEELRDFMVGYIHEQVGDRPDLIEKLIPDYAPMLRRPVVDNGWYRALTRDNVELVTEGITRLDAGGIETGDGTHRDFDIVIFATGYDVTTYLWPTEYVGRDGVELQAFWAEDSPRAYLGMMVPDFPNFFMLYGPNSQPVSGGISLPSWFQIWAAYIAQCLEKIIEEGHGSVSVTPLAYKEYNRRLDEEASALAFEQDAKSVDRNYYVNASGRLQANTPFETADLWEMQKAPKPGELEFG